ncbi:MoxR family ATPase [Litoricola sp.]|nr:MoxR family ATPase [Litorivicinus sp.]
MDNQLQVALQSIRTKLLQSDYLCDEQLASSVHLALELKRPLLLEGDAGVGKTALAQALAGMVGRPLIRLQCFEGLDHHDAVYEWNYGRQLTEIRLAEAASQRVDSSSIYSEEFLIQKPILKALRELSGAVLLIDEIDRSDEAFEAYLLEALSDYQVSIPELGTVRSEIIPIVILTSNGTRDLSDALRRRCLYHYIEYPDVSREADILRLKVPDADRRLIEQAAQFVNSLRKEDLEKKPGIAESIDWLKALMLCGFQSMPDDPLLIRGSLSCLIKTARDRVDVNDDILQRLLA